MWKGPQPPLPPRPTVEDVVKRLVRIETKIHALAEALGVSIEEPGKGTSPLKADPWNEQRKET